MNPQPDALLSALDQITNTLYWYRERAPGLTASTALTEAIDDWLAEQSAEHHHSRPFKPHCDNEGERDPLGVAIEHLQVAVVILRAVPGRDPDLTFSAALTEAVVDWTASEAAEHHSSEAFDLSVQHRPLALTLPSG